MTKNNFQKTAIRQRMEATGEPYSVAAREIAALPAITWPSLDNALAGGFKPGHFYVIAAQPKVGKNLVAVNLAIKLSRPNQQIAFINLESSETELIQSLIRVDAGVSAVPLSENELTDSERKAVNRSLKHISKNVLLPQALNTIEKIREYLLSQPKLKAVVIDYFQLVETEATGTLLEKRAYAAQAVKKLALELDIAVILMAQLHRSPDAKASTLMSVSGVSELSASADVVIHLSRVEYSDIIGFHVLKHRQGALSSFSLSWPQQESKKLMEIETI